MAPIQQVVVFDFEEEALEHRVDVSEQIIARLAAEGFFPGEIPSVIGFRDRQDCLDHLSGMACTLLIADMNARDEPTVGNQGARLVRAAAQNASSYVYRILWTRFDHPMVASGIAPFAHALVAYDHDRERRVELLEQGIRHVLAGELDPKPPLAQFTNPIEARPHEQRLEEAVVQKLLRGGKLREGEMLAVGSILQGAPDVWINQELAKAYDGHSRQTHCPNVNDFLKRISADVEQARRRVCRVLSDFAQRDVNTLLTPRIVQRAKEAQGASWRRTHLTTWLTEMEDDLARTFFEVYDRVLDETNRDRPKPLSAHAFLDLKPVLDQATEDPEVQQLMDEYDFGPDDLNYAVFSFVDTAGSALERSPG